MKKITYKQNSTMKKYFFKRKAVTALLLCSLSLACSEASIMDTDAGNGFLPPITQNDAGEVMPDTDAGEQDLGSDLSVKISFENEALAIVGTELNLRADIVNMGGIGHESPTWNVEIPSACDSKDEIKLKNSSTENYNLASYQLKCAGEYIFSFSIVDEDENVIRDSKSFTASANVAVELTAETTDMHAGSFINLKSTVFNPGDLVLTEQWQEVEAPQGCSSDITGAESTERTDTIIYNARYEVLCAGHYKLSFVVETDAAEPIERFIEFDATDTRSHVINFTTSRTFLRGFEITLDASNTRAARGEDLTYSWNLSLPAGCSTGTIEDPAAMRTSFTPACIGTYQVRLKVEDSVSSTEKIFPIAVTQSLLVTMGVGPANAYPQATLVDLNVDLDSLPTGVNIGDLTYKLIATPAAGFTAPTITLNQASQRFTVTPSEAHAEYALKGYVTYQNVSGLGVTGNIAVPNNHPTMSLSMDYISGFNLGDAVTITANVADLDGDTLTCKGVIAANAAGLSYSEEVYAVNDKCVFRIATSGVEQASIWNLNVTVSDGHGGMASASQGFHPENNAPVISQMELKLPRNSRGQAQKLGYRCNSTTCTLDSFKLHISVEDDFDDFDDLQHSFELSIPGQSVSGYVLSTEILAEGDLKFTIKGRRGQKMLNNYSIKYTVKDRGVDNNGASSSSSRSIILRISKIENKALILSGYEQFEKQHKYNASTKKFETEFEGRLVMRDPENNSKSSFLSVNLVSCGQTPAVNNICTNNSGTTKLTAEINSNGTYNLKISSSKTKVTVGDFMVNFVAKDIENTISYEGTLLKVRNVKPELDFHSVEGNIGRETIYTKFFIRASSDENGDPLTLTEMKFKCPKIDTNNIFFGTIPGKEISARVNRTIVCKYRKGGITNNFYQEVKWKWNNAGTERNSKIYKIKLDSSTLNGFTRVSLSETPYLEAKLTDGFTNSVTFFSKKVYAHR